MPSDTDLIVAGRESLSGWLEAAAEAPAAAALLCDIDGTISPIAARPADARVPAATRDLLAALVRRLGLVAFATGRALDVGRRMIPLDGAVYVGTHGLELRGADGVTVLEPEAEPYVAAIAEIAALAAAELDCERLGVVLEDKRSVLAIHYRLAGDVEAVRAAILERVVAPARARGLAISTGHFAIEVSPPLPITKGTAVRRLLDDGAFRCVLTCGDDLTDVNMFVAAREWAAAEERPAADGGGRPGTAGGGRAAAGGGERLAAAVAALTDETPAAVREAADVLVRATPGVHAVLTRLAAAVGAV